MVERLSTVEDEGIDTALSGRSADKRIQHLLNGKISRGSLLRLFREHFEETPYPCGEVCNAYSILYWCLSNEFSSSYCGGARGGETEIELTQADQENCEICLEIAVAEGFPEASAILGARTYNDIEHEYLVSAAKVYEIANQPDKEQLQNGSLENRDDPKPSVIPTKVKSLRSRMASHPALPRAKELLKYAVNCKDDHTMREMAGQHLKKLEQFWEGFRDEDFWANFGS